MCTSPVASKELQETNTEDLIVTASAELRPDVGLVHLTTAATDKKYKSFSLQA